MGARGGGETRTALDAAAHKNHGYTNHSHPDKQYAKIKGAHTDNDTTTMNTRTTGT